MTERAMSRLQRQRPRRQTARLRKPWGRHLLRLAATALMLTACTGTDAIDTSTTPGASIVSTTTTVAIVSTTTKTTIAEPSTSTSSGSGFDAPYAMEVADLYFAAYREGNHDELFSLFIPEATVWWFARYSAADFEKTTAFFIGQGTVLTPPDCEVSYEVPGEEIHVFCHFEASTAAAQAIDAPSVDSRFTMIITPDGIARLSFSYDEELDFHPVEDPFVRWVQTNYPGQIAFDDWSTVEQARQQGLLMADYALEWAAYLEANNCTYTEGC